jgi:RNA polymerase sigma factor (sigma-70 family)
VDRAQFLRGLESVYEEAWETVPAWCRRHGLDEQLARDALQDLAVEICEHWTRPPDVRLLRHYVRCRVINAMRKRRAPVARETTALPRPEETAAHSERITRLREAVERCSGREREVVILMEEDNSLRSAARRLGANRHQVDQLWRRICARFRAVIGDAV